MHPTKIDWADYVFNPVTGCTPISEGCAHCYARRMAQRLAGRFGYPKDDPFRVTVHDDRDGVSPGEKPSIIFVGSMGDVFHDDVPDDFLGHLMTALEGLPHIYCILTKRPDNMERRFKRLAHSPYHQWGVCDFECYWREGKLPLQNVWLGVSVENCRRVVERVPVLIHIPAALRFVSCEPLLAPVYLHPWLGNDEIMWVIVGRETGPAARPCDPGWVQRIIDDCRAVGVPVWLKDNLNWPERIQEMPWPDHEAVRRHLERRAAERR